MVKALAVFATWIVLLGSCTADPYSETIALRAVRYASAAYCPDEERLRAWSCESCLAVPGLSVVDVFSDPQGVTAGYGFVGVQPELQHIVVSFRGTIFTTEGAVIDDLEFLSTPYPPGVPGAGVHMGFLDYFRSVNETLRAALQQTMETYPGYPVWYVGHSLGAAVALIAAADLLDMVTPQLVYTFGTPRVGNYEWSIYFNSVLGPVSWRVVHSRDIVVRLPPCPWNFELRRCEQKVMDPFHVVTEVFYNDDMTSYTVCDQQSGEDSNCSDQYPFWEASITCHRFYFGFQIGNPGMEVAKWGESLILTEIQ